MSTLKTAALAVLIPLALTAPAMAQDGRGPGPEMIFAEIDLNGDGAVTLDELTAAREGRFARADADGDNRLTREELLAQAMARAETRIDRMLEQADTDADGALTAAEIDAMRDADRMARTERLFARADADGDGQVTEAEFADAMARLQDRRGGGHGHGHGHGDRGGFWNWRG